MAVPTCDLDDLSDEDFLENMFDLTEGMKSGRINKQTITMCAGCFVRIADIMITICERKENDPHQRPN